jgi:transcription antitermination protein NusB
VAARSKARRRAVEVLFEAEMRNVDPLAVLADRVRRADPPINPYTNALVEGVVANRERIDELLSTYSISWTLDRMPAVDRNVLRLGTYELLWEDDVPDAVAVDEAVELVKDLSTEESPNFVNGLLGRLMTLKPMLLSERG